MAIALRPQICDVTSPYVSVNYGPQKSQLNLGMLGLGLAHLLLARNDTHDRDMHSTGCHQLMTQEDAAEAADD